VKVYTATLGYDGPDRLDVSRKGNHPRGVVFAPSPPLLRGYQVQKRRARATPDQWHAYVNAYLAEMTASRAVHPETWRWLLAQPEVTLCCYCRDGVPCHRRALAALLVALGATYEGER